MREPARGHAQVSGARQERGENARIAGRWMDARELALDLL
jgi:hypothetical protein